jgi:pyruvate,water dikinase
LGGYVYLSPNSIADEAVIAARAELFGAPGGYYYEQPRSPLSDAEFDRARRGASARHPAVAHWEELDRRWREKVRAEIRELEALEVPELPEVEDETLVRKGSVGSSHRLLEAYDRLLASFDRFCQYHFELMNLGYGALPIMTPHRGRRYPRPGAAPRQQGPG